MAGTSTISGLVSGLDTAGILAQLKEAASAPITRLQNQQAAAKAKLSAWQDINTRLLAFKTEASSLAFFSNFADKTASSSNEDMVTVSASSSASAGDYSFTVDSLAKTHKINSQGYALDTDLVGTGTVDIAIGDGSAVSITVEEGTTLAGLRDKINRADAGVAAFIVNTGAGDTPYQLVITSKSSGTAGAIDITSTLTGGVTPTFTDLQAAADATISLGNGLTVTRSSNTINDIFPGLTLNLHSADVNETVTVSVSHDTAGVKEKIVSLVDKYNDLVGYLQEQWKYDSDTEETGTLFGEYTLFEIQANLASRFSSSVAGLSSDLSVLSQIGIRMGTDGKLALTESDLEEALVDNPDGVMKLFSRYGTASNSNVGFISGTSDTQPSGPAGYAIAVTQAATHTRLTAGIAQSDILAEDETLTINDIEIQLTAGMTQAQVITAINSKSSQTKVTAAATDINGAGSGQYLTLATTGYGSHVHIETVSSRSNAATISTGFGNTTITEANAAGEAGTGTGAAGLDIAGTINGEAAEGSGQMLKSTAGDSKGLWVKVNAVAPGDYGTLVFTRGVAAALDEQLSFLTDDDNGAIHIEEDSLQAKIDDLDASIKRMQATVDREQARLEAQFVALETSLSTLKSQGTYLESQLAALSG
jgi:flagellar hook-associated protein 2